MNFRNVRPESLRIALASAVIILLVGLLAKALHPSNGCPVGQQVMAGGFYNVTKSWLNPVKYCEKQ